MKNEVKTCPENDDTVEVEAKEGQNHYIWKEDKLGKYGESEILTGG